MGLIAFYDNDKFIQAVPDTTGQDFKPEKNDAINFVRLYNVRPGCIIELFDSPDRSLEDDYTSIKVKKISCEYSVESLETNIDNEYITEIFHEKNGLNRRVSRITITN